MYYYQNELTHSGRKGMKWGTRNGPPYPLSRQARFKDGFESYNKNLKPQSGRVGGRSESITNKTSKDSNTAKDVARAVGKAAYKAYDTFKNREANKTKAILERGSKKQLLKRMKHMSNEELAVAKERLQLLKSVKDVNKGEKSRGYELASKGLEWLKLGNDYTQNALNIKNNFDKLTGAGENKVTKRYANKAIDELQKQFKKKGYNLNNEDVNKVQNFLSNLNTLENYATGRGGNNQGGNKQGGNQGQQQPKQQGGNQYDQNTRSELTEGVMSFLSRNRQQNQGGQNGRSGNGSNRQSQQPDQQGRQPEQQTDQQSRKQADQQRRDGFRLFGRNHTQSSSSNSSSSDRSSSRRSDSKQESYTNNDIINMHGNWHMSVAELARATGKSKKTIERILGIR